MLYLQIVGVEKLCQIHLAHLLFFRRGDRITLRMQKGDVLGALIMQHAVLRKFTCCRIFMVDGLFKKELDDVITIHILIIIDNRHALYLRQHFSGRLDHLFGFFFRRHYIIFGTSCQEACTRH